jgi:hypothetical protein
MENILANQSRAWYKMRTNGMLKMPIGVGKIEEEINHSAQN